MSKFKYALVITNTEEYPIVTFYDSVENAEKALAEQFKNECEEAEKAGYAHMDSAREENGRYASLTYSDEFDTFSTTIEWFVVGAVEEGEI